MSPVYTFSGFCAFQLVHAFYTAHMQACGYRTHAGIHGCRTHCKCPFFPLTFWTCYVSQQLQLYTAILCDISCVDQMQQLCFCLLTGALQDSVALAVRKMSATTSVLLAEHVSHWRMTQNQADTRRTASKSHTSLACRLQLENKPHSHRVHIFGKCVKEF